MIYLPGVGMPLLTTGRHNARKSNSRNYLVSTNIELLDNEG